MSGKAGAEPWDTGWAAEQAAAALRYLGRNAPEVLENTGVLADAQDLEAQLQAIRARIQGREQLGELVGMHAGAFVS
jgi:hypothetical protein